LRRAQKVTIRTKINARRSAVQKASKSKAPNVLVTLRSVQLGSAQTPRTNLFAAKPW
jgi:hypothetical protein